MQVDKNKLNSVVLGIDIGGTGIGGALINLRSLKFVGEPIKIATPNPPTFQSMISVIKDLIDHFEWKGKVGCGFPGIVKKSVIYSATNLADDWIGVNLSDEIRKITSENVVVVNDADAAALAEMKFGAGKKYNKIGGGVVLIITLGTGIGTAIFVNGHLVPNTELGQIEIDGFSAEKKAATIIREKEGLNWEEWTTRVNKYLSTIEFLLSPDLIIIGGGISENPEKFFQFINIETNVVSAKMGNDAGIIGAALAVKEKELFTNNVTRG